jgi:hypothetical protein
MRDERSQRARRVPVASDEPLIGGDGYDYADAFEIRLAESDSRSAEEFTRCALEQAPWPVRWVVRNVHRHVLRFRLGPHSSPDHVLGWRIVTAEPDTICLEAVSPLFGRGVIVARRPEPTRAVVTTYVFFARPAQGRAIWRFVGPLHRRVAPSLLEHAAAAPSRAKHAGAAPTRVR